MNFKDIANMDMETALQWLLLGWRWWINELTAMLPPQWRALLARRSRVVAEFDGGAIVYRKEGSSEILPAKPRGRIRFLMPPGQVLTRQMDLPLLPMSDIKRMLALDIDRLTPFHADQVFFDAEIITRDQDSGRQQVALGVLPRSVVAQTMADVREHNLQPASLGMAVREGSIGSGFDFLAAMRETQGGDAAQRRSLYWWGAAAGLVALNLLLFGYRDSNNLDQLRQTVEAQQAPVAVAVRTRDKVDREAARRAALLESQARTSPLPVLDAVTRAMPPDAWVKRFEWNGRTVHVTGTRKTSPDIIARLEASPVLRNARSLSNDTHTADAAASQQFDLTADRERGSAR